MNHQQVEYAWENSPLAGSKLLVHLAIAADSSNAGYCWSTINHLAQEAKCSYMTVRNAIRELQANGALQIEEMYGHKQVFHLIQNGQAPAVDDPEIPEMTAE